VSETAISESLDSAAKRGASAESSIAVFIFRSTRWGFTRCIGNAQPRYCSVMFANLHLYEWAATHRCIFGWRRTRNGAEKFSFNRRCQRPQRVVGLFERVYTGFRWIGWRRLKQGSAVSAATQSPDQVSRVRLYTEQQTSLVLQCAARAHIELQYAQVRALRAQCRLRDFGPLERNPPPIK
jgi:hypothetical protein